MRCCWAIKKHEICLRTLGNYKVRLEQDIELAKIFQDLLSAIDRSWAKEAAPALRSCIDFLHRAANEGDPTDPKQVEAVPPVGDRNSHHQSGLLGSTKAC